MSKSRSSSRLKGAVSGLRQILTTKASGLSAPEATVGLAGYAASFSPSLLPRPWYAQGLVAGIGAMSTYQAAVLAKWSGRMALHLIGQGRPPKAPRPGNVRVGMALAVISGVAVPLASLRQQRNTARYVGHPEPGLSWVLASTASGAVTFSMLSAQWAFTQRLIDAVQSRLDGDRSWEELSRLIATIVTLGTEWLIINRIIWRGILGVASSAANRVDRRIPLGVHQPRTELHSGGPGSLESWEGLGSQGKRFAAAGPSRKDILDVMGPGSAQQPIRAYASLRGRTLPTVIDQVIAELDRMDAWQRSAILLTTTTGRGNVNEWSASAFEYLNRGDCANVALQYSNLPSALTLLSGRQHPTRAAGLLLAAVEDRISKLPEASRPKIYLGGESLGAFGSCGAFNTPAEMVSRIAGAVFTGCPAITPLLETIVTRRDPESSATMPTYHRGRHIRFAGRLANFDPPDDARQLADWTEPRIAFLQNETDPVAFWSPKLLWRRPDWDQEPQRVGPMAQMHWLPGITFWQLAADMPVCRSLRAGYGHKYGAQQTVPAWAAVLGKPEHRSNAKLVDALQRSVPLVNP